MEQAVILLAFFTYLLTTYFVESHFVGAAAHGNKWCFFTGDGFTLDENESVSMNRSIFIQAIYFIVNIILEISVYFGCIIWKIVSYNHLLSFLLGVGFTSMVFIQGPDSPFAIVKRFIAFMRIDDNNDNSQNGEQDKTTKSMEENVPKESEEKSIAEIQDEESTSEKSEQRSTLSEAKNEDVISAEPKENHALSETKEEFISTGKSTEEKESSLEVTQSMEESSLEVIQSKENKVENNEIITLISQLNELEEKMGKQISELNNKFSQMKNEVMEVKNQESENERMLENSLNQIKIQSKKLTVKTEDYITGMEHLDSVINTMDEKEETGSGEKEKHILQAPPRLKKPIIWELSQNVNDFPTEDDVVKWFHASLCPMVGSKDDLHPSQTLHEERCFNFVSRSSHAHEVLQRFSDMVAVSEYNDSEVPE